MRKLIPLLLSLLLLLSSCELFYDEAELGDVYVISIGIDYKNEPNDSNETGILPNLRGTVPDAKELFTVLKDITLRTGRNWHGYLLLQEGTDHSADTFSTFDPDTGIYASKTHLFTVLTSIKSQAQPEDLVIITYSGHGIDENGDMVMAHTTSTGGVAIEPLRISPSLLIDQYLVPIQAKKLLILDSCVSGVFVPESQSSLSTVLDNSIDDWYAKYWEESTYGLPNLFVMTASALTDSYEIDVDSSSNVHVHGVFSTALLKALGWDHPHDADIGAIVPSVPPAIIGSDLTVDSLYAYIKKHQSLPVRWNIFKPSRNYQHPLVSGGALDMVLFRF